MQLYGRPYRVGLANTAFTALRTIMEITAPATAIVVVTDAEITQLNSETSTQEGLEWVRKSGAGTGTAGTIVPLQPLQGATTGLSARYNCTVEGTVTDVFPAMGFNIVSGWRFQPLPTGFIVVPPSGILGLRWQSAPEASVDVNGWIEFVVVG